MDAESLEKRLSAVERALTNEGSEPHGREVDRRVEDLEERIRDLEAATQALRGYVGDVRQRDQQQASHPDSELQRVQRMEFQDQGQTPVGRHSPNSGNAHHPGSCESDEGMLDRLAAWL